MFETIRVREGRIPFFADHLARLEDALRRTGGGDLPRGLAERVREREAEGECVVRCRVDAAGVTIAVRPVPAARPFHVRLAAPAHQPYPLKRTERALFDRVYAEAAAAGADEALLLTDDGCLAEGTITSVAFWRRDTLCLPALDLGILPGIGRARVIAVARVEGVAVEEGRYVRGDFSGRALLLVNAVRGIIAVATLDGAPTPRAPLAGRLDAAFWPRG